MKTYLFILLLLVLPRQNKTRQETMAVQQQHQQEQDQDLRLSITIEEILLARMENVNPAPTNAFEDHALTEFLEFAQRYATLVEPSELFARRIFAFLDTMHNQRFRALHQEQQQQQQQQQQQRATRVQVTRVGAKRVFGADITHELDQNRNIAANL